MSRWDSTQFESDVSLALGRYDRAVVATDDDLEILCQFSDAACDVLVVHNLALGEFYIRGRAQDAGKILRTYNKAYVELLKWRLKGYLVPAGLLRHLRPRVA